MTSLRNGSSEDMTLALPQRHTVPPPPTGGVAAIRAGVARMIVRRAVEPLPVRLTLPDGSKIGGGDDKAPRMLVHRPDAFYARLGSDAKLGFGEAYMAGDWDTGPGTDLAELLTPFAGRMAELVPKPLQRFRRLVERRQPSTEENTPTRPGRTSTGTTTCPTTCSSISWTRR